MKVDALSGENDRGTPGRRTGGLGLASHIRGWMLVVGLVPLVVLFAYGNFAARAALIEASDDHLMSVVGGRKARIESWLRERMTDLEVISRSQDCNALVQSADSHQEHTQVCRYLDSFQTGARDYQVLALYDRDWNWVASQSGSEAHREALVDPELRAAVAGGGGPILSAVHHHEKLGIGIHAGNVLQLPGGPPVGYVVASLDLTGTFAPILEDRAGLGRTGHVLLGDVHGDLFMTSGGEADPTATLDSRIVERAASAPTGTIHYRSPSGASVFAGYTVIPDQGWILVAEMDRDEALSLLHSLRRGFLIAGLITLIGVIVLSSRSSRRLSTPLAELARAARRIKEGNPHQRVPLLGGSEVAEVGRAFNEMLDALDEVQRQRIQAGTLAAVGELSSNIVHEMRNRLSSVKMNLQALERRLRTEDDYAELSRIALEQVRRTEETLTELLNYARPMELTREPFAAGALLNSLAERFRAEAASRKVELIVEDRTGGRHVQGDRRLLEQAMSDLMRNAFEATGSGGRVVLRAGPQTPSGGWLALEVEDDGPGFKGAAPAELFQPFFTTKDRGAGLGLAQARKITELHGGRISAAGAAGGGAVFRVELPWKESEA